MPRAQTASAVNEPKSKVDRILSDLIGRDYDLLTEKGRTNALEAIDKPDLPADKSQSEQPEIPEGDSRTAWEAARGLCADVQLGAALSQLDGLKELPDHSDPMSADAVDDFASVKQQLRDQLMALKSEYADENDEEVLNSIHNTLFRGEDALFDRLKAAGNFDARNVNDRTEERQIIHYLAIRAFTAQLCSFPLSCLGPAREPVEAGSRIGRALGITERALRCAKETADRLRDQFEEIGISDDCAPDSIGGLDFVGDETTEDDGNQGGEADPPTSGQEKARGRRTQSTAKAEKRSSYDGASEPPCMLEFFSILRRVEDDAEGWLEGLDRDGKRGAHLIRGEIERLDAKARRYKPARRKDMHEPEYTTRLRELVGLLVSQIGHASDGIHKLLDTPDT